MDGQTEEVVDLLRQILSELEMANLNLASIEGAVGMLESAVGSLEMTVSTLGP